MKKAYLKPEVFYEEYELCTAIAGNCGIVGDDIPFPGVNYNNGNVCSFDMGDGAPLFSNSTVCAEIFSEENSPFCYQQPTGDQRLFNS